MVTGKTFFVVIYASIAAVSFYGLGFKVRPLSWGPPRLLIISDILQGFILSYYPRITLRHFLASIATSKNPFAKLAMMVVRRSGARENSEAEQAAMIVWFYGVVCAGGMVILITMA
jgi:hypothetical protein